jgi:hypothetical protein
MNLQKVLGQIAQEYRTGAREPTVISHAMDHDESVEQEEMFEQICQDLEDKEVHPDSIDLNKSFLDQWLSEVLEAGSLNEGSVQAFPKLEKSTSLAKGTPIPSAGQVTSSASISDEGEYSRCNVTVMLLTHLRYV